MGGLRGVIQLILIHNYVDRGVSCESSRESIVNDVGVVEFGHCSYIVVDCSCIVVVLEEYLVADADDSRIDNMQHSLVVVVILAW